MTDTHDNIDTDEEPVLPRALVDDLAELYRPPVSLAAPRRVDDAVTRAAREQLDGTRRDAGRSLSSSWTLRRALPWGLAAAAAITVAVTLVTLNTVAPADPRDVDANGRIDILDAFALARRIEAMGHPGDVADAHDVTGDGVVDRADVDAIALAAVKLNGGRG